ncbi:MAG TPA: recombinase family protein [Symbiobacteriaceae bacterium]|nr:recombinase family protein [Symbiobacteriaceae bacterium]
MSKEVRPDHVAMYIRWSTEDQGDGTTLEVQQEACDLYIRSQGWQVRKDLVFVDDGYSGGNLRRPAIGALRKAILDGRVDCVVVFKLDRLSRSVVDTVNLVLEEWEGRSYFKSAREPIDTATPAGKMFFYLLASYAEWERNVIRERTAGGRQQRACQGYWACGPTPYGYTTDEQKRLIVVESHAAVIRQIFDRYLRGDTMTDIVQELQAQGAPAPKGPGQWSKPLVRHILSNQVYIGVMQYGRWKANPRHGRDATAPRLVKAETPSVKLEGACPAIVDEATFWTVQKTKADRDARKTKNSGRAYSSQWLLSGIAKCAKCGSSFATRASRRGRSPYYYCLGRAFKLSCDCRQIQVGELDTWFVGELKRVYGDSVRRQQALASLDAEHQGRMFALRASINAVKGQLEQLERERTQLRRRFRGGEITQTIYEDFMAEVEREHEAHRSRVIEVEEEMARVEAQANSKDIAEQLKAVDIFETLEPKDRKHLVFKLVQSLTVYRAPNSDEVEAAAVWKLPIGLST